MPCYDKKLEASRTQFKNDDGCAQTECVISSGRISGIVLKLLHIYLAELLEWLTEENVDFTNGEDRSLPSTSAQVSILYVIQMKNYFELNFSATPTAIIKPPAKATHMRVAQVADMH
jgi:iron only hydrogenase large subunit-like protein